MTPNVFGVSSLVLTNVIKLDHDDGCTSLNMLNTMDRYTLTG